MACAPANPEQELDINDVFDSIALTEEHVVASAYAEGFAKGVDEGDIEVFHLGYHKGSEIGRELGESFGVATALLTLMENDQLSEDTKKILNEKTVKVLKKIVDDVNAFPSSNSSSIDVSLERDKIRALYRRVCSLLKSKDSRNPSKLLTF